MTDITTLSRESSTRSPRTTVPSPPRRWLTRLALPIVIVLAVLALIGYAMRGVLLPAKAVEVVRAIAINSPTPSDGEPAALMAGPATVVAQAPGWIEPDPYPIYVSALADGVVAKVHVLEGEPVKAGQVLVELVEDDARLALEQARAELSLRQAALSAAQTDLDEPVALRRAQAVSRARLAEAEAALARLDAEVAKEEARLEELSAAYVRLTEVSAGSVSALQVDAAKYQAQSQRAVVKATEQRRPELEAAIDSARAELAAAKRDLELKTPLIKARDEAAASVQSAQVRVAEAQLRLDRMKLKSPADGIVMARLVAPGSKLMLGMDSPHSTHAIHLYQPEALQVRVDVPIVDAAVVGVGQRAVVMVDVLPDTEFAGVVTRLVHQADLAKNTVQCKVALDNPSPLLKPDMLARVKFLSTAGGLGSAGQSARASASGGAGPVLIQRRAVVNADDGAFVWWVSPTDSRLRRRAVTLGGDRGDGLVEVRDGLNPADVVVDRPDAALTEGQRVRYTLTAQ